MIDAFNYWVTDLISGQVLEELPFSEFSYERAKNAPGGWEARISHRHPKVTDDLLAPWRRGIFVGRSSNILAGGMLTSRNSDTNEGLKIGGAGFLDYYRNKRRRIHSRSGMTYATGSNSLEITFSAVDQFNIVTDLLAHAANYAGLANLGYSTVNLRGPGVGGISGVPRTRTYWSYELKNIGDAIDDLAKLYGGFEYAESYYWDGNFIRRQLDLYYPAKGLTAGIEFELGRNVILLDRTEDGSEVCTRYLAVGSGQEDAQLSSEVLNLSQESPAGVYPMLELDDSFTDLSTSALLDAQALRGVKERERPFETIQLRVKEDAEVRLGSFDWGDNVRVLINDAGIQVNGLYRIESFHVDIDVNGKTNIEPTVTSYSQSIGI